MHYKSYENSITLTFNKKKFFYMFITIILTTFNIAHNIKKYHTTSQ